MVQFRLVSDLHLEFHKRIHERTTNKLIPPFANDASSYLILAGDIANAISNTGKIHDKLIAFLTIMKRRFLGVLYVSGNHEYYNNVCKLCRHNLKIRKNQNVAYGPLPECSRCVSVESVDTLLKEKCKELGVVYLQKESVIIDGVFVHGCTLFSDFRDLSWTYMNDVGNICTTIEPLQAIHLDHQRWLRELEMKTGEKHVIITHYLPTCELMNGDHSPYDGGYYTDTYDQMRQCDKIKVWVCGHSHVSRTYISPKHTRFYMNPCGYKSENLPVQLCTFSVCV